MSERKPEPFGDAITQPFWEAADRRELLIQRCGDCGRHQFYPRPFCKTCHSQNVAWVKASGEGTVHSMTRIWHSPDPDQPTPYINALVELDEGPRLFTSLTVDDMAIGQRVRVVWREREGQPPLPVFEPRNEKP